MILIRVSETGFVSGQAWETIAYEGDVNSRVIHTILNEQVIDKYMDDENFMIAYKISSKLLECVVEIPLDSDYNITIPSEFMDQSQRLWLQLLVKTDTIKFHSNIFTLDIDSSIGRDANVILKPGAETFIVVSSIDKRNSIPRSQLANGKVVKVEGDGFYTWDDNLAEWKRGALEISDVSNLASVLSDLSTRVTALEERNNG